VLCFYNTVGVVCESVPLIIIDNVTHKISALDLQPFVLHNRKSLNAVPALIDLIGF